MSLLSGGIWGFGTNPTSQKYIAQFNGEGQNTTFDLIPGFRL
jgi:hypothetical protein